MDHNLIESKETSFIISQSMSANLNIKIGCKGTQDPNKYSSLDIICHLDAHKVESLSQQIRVKSGRGSVPFLAIQLPTLDFQGLEVPTVQKKYFKSGQHKSNNKIVHWAIFKQDQNSKMLKKIQKAFHKIAQLRNQLQLRLKFYDLDRIQKSLDQQKKGVNLIKNYSNGLIIEGKLKTDVNFITVLKQAINAVSPSFNQSPIIAGLQLFELLEIDLQLDSLESLSGQNTNKLFGDVSVNEDPEDRIIKKLRSCKEEMFVYITIPGISCIQIKAQARLFGLIQSLL